MIETSSVPPRKSSATFGNLRQSLENVRKMFADVHQAFGTILENLRKVVGNLQKVVKNIVISMFISKQNNTWTLGDMEFILSCSHSISHSFAALTRSISMWTLEDKFHISARPCIILHIYIDYVIESATYGFLFTGCKTLENERVSAANEWVSQCFATRE